MRPDRGSWHLTDDTVNGPNGELICRLGLRAIDDGPLIAAALDLLAACQAAYETWYGWKDVLRTNMTEEDWQKHNEMLQTTIAKATREEL